MGPWSPPSWEPRLSEQAAAGSAGPAEHATVGLTRRPAGCPHPTKQLALGTPCSPQAAKDLGTYAREPVGAVLRAHQLTPHKDTPQASVLRCRAAPQLQLSQAALRPVVRDTEEAGCTAPALASALPLRTPLLLYLPHSCSIHLGNSKWGNTCFLPSRNLLSYISLGK